MIPEKSPIAHVEAISDGRLIVWDFSQSRKLYQSGYYGKPLGIAKPRDDFDAPLILDPIEGVFLLEKGLITVSSSNGTIMDSEELRLNAQNILDGFDLRYLVYHDLREKGFIVTPGIKYGCDFAVYEHGPGVDHAPFIVQVKTSDEEITAQEIVESGRLASTVRKTFIIAVISGSKVNYYSFKWWRP